MDQDRAQSGVRWQFRLRDLAVVVVGASGVLDVARRSRAGWGGGWPDVNHAVGLLVLTMALGLAWGMLGPAVARVREPVGTRAWAWAWRGALVVWLVGMLGELVSALPAVAPKLSLFEESQVMVRLRLASLMTSLGLVGLVLAIAPLHAGPLAVRRPRRWAVVAVPLAVLAGLALWVLQYNPIVYLILIAIEAVQNALTRAPLIARPGLFDRLTVASLQAIPGLLGCLATAIWVDDDLRAAVADPARARAARSWFGVVARVTTVVVAAAGAVVVMVVSIPLLSPSLAEGIAMSIAPGWLAMIACGFAWFAAGFAARSAAWLVVGATRPTGTPDQVSTRLGIWPRRIIGGIIGIISVELVAAAVQVVIQDDTERWYIPVSLSEGTRMLMTPINWLNPKLHFHWTSLIDRPDVVLILGAAVWLTVGVGRLVLFPHQGDRTAPLDLVAADRLALGRFFGWWVGLTTAILASLPGLVIVGVALVHQVLFWSAR